MPDTTARRSAAAHQPVLGPLVDGDLCDIAVHTRGGRRYCHQPAVTEAVDVDGRVRLLCGECRDRLFPAQIAS